MIYVLCPDANKPVGGVKKLYRHVDVLNRNHIPACIVHHQDGFKCTWFENNTRISYLSKVMAGYKFNPSDYLLLPENRILGFFSKTGEIKKVIFNQGCYNTFADYPPDRRVADMPYLSGGAAAVLVVSDDSRDYLSYTFPHLKIYRVYNGIDSSVFYYNPEKKKQVAFMINKGYGDLLQVLNILRYRDALGDFKLIPINNKTESEVAEIMRESAIFLSFGKQEGFGLPPAEAMACGCIVIGYHGFGGREYFKPEYGFPIEQDDVITFAKTLEQVMNTYAASPLYFSGKTAQAARFISRTYSLQKEEKDIVEAWTHILESRQD